MNRREISDSIPTDLIMEIFSRLPSKSIARFYSLSKLWGSMLSSLYFRELFRTRSLARPRLLFAVQGDGEEFFYSSPQPHNHQYEKKSLVVAADYHKKFSGQMNRDDDICSCASGLVYFPQVNVRRICNPITGQYVTLPELEYCQRQSKSYLGFDPIDKQFKLLLMNTKHHNEILTLGTDKVRWRTIQCPFIHNLLDLSIWINGVLFYLAENLDGDTCPNVIVCFDVRSEKFKLIDAECFPNPYGMKLVNSKGKLGGIELMDDPDSIFDELHMWVLEDEDKHEWSKCVYTLPKKIIFKHRSIYVAGVTAAGEIVLSERFMTYKPFHVYYFNPKRNTLQSVEIQGLGAGLKYAGAVYTFVDYVEDLRFIDATQVQHLYAPSVREE